MNEKTTSLNSTLIDICFMYQSLVKDLSALMKKVYESKEPAEIHDLIVDAHASYTKKLLEVHEKIEKLKTELNLAGLDLNDLTIH